MKIYFIVSLLILNLYYGCHVYYFLLFLNLYALYDDMLEVM
jgi:hypothetical protein